MNIINYSPESNGCGGGCSTPPPTPSNVANPTPELHICMGLNACKGHDRFGTNACAGTGYCATALAHSCHTMNNCRNQGGCGLFGDGHEQDLPGENHCAWQGSCAVPIQAERFSTEGKNQGKSVWMLARKLFEERMKKARRNVGSSPYECGPPEAWLIEQNSQFGSCGQSGSPSCSFGFNDKYKNAQDLCNDSKKKNK
ncbi:MAG: hypothetical protein IAF38_09700 [Bacteroidia bacterium]|nr:hypothetical protein [Bacteroidia bacterium]